ncbi:malonyl-CoA decarboxylase [Aquisediminimonas profunda]|uniref:malonyl-CoA decarboxylase n=1 Tax=Aquisediminimonas profunda TaxID=1550733 RepID=UPI001C636DA5|nr:malonyl-CoA decarboxylase [Aquisediminimonas profunda]
MHNSAKTARAQQRPWPRPISGTSRDLRDWVHFVWESIVLGGRRFPVPADGTHGVAQLAEVLAQALLSTRGEASGATIAQELLDLLDDFSIDDRARFLVFLSERFDVDHDLLAKAARAYLDKPGWEMAARLAAAAEPPRQELLRRINMGHGGTRRLISLREDLATLIPANPILQALDTDLRHLLASWFNRGFLELRQIDWQTSASILERLITYEAVHEVQGWDDLRRRLAPDRRCFGFFHPALPDDPLIFVEVALVEGLAGSVDDLLERNTDERTRCARAEAADTAIFYSISNCQAGLRGISFGNFLIKQVVEILRVQLPALRRFATLSPVPGFRNWLDRQLAQDLLPDCDWPAAIRKAFGPVEDLAAALKDALGQPGWEKDPAANARLGPLLCGLCAVYLTRSATVGQSPIDPVARFHLSNGARLERVNWMGNPGERGLRESWGIMVNYEYDPVMIEANRERFTRAREVARSREVDVLIGKSESGPRRLLEH